MIDVLIIIVFFVAYMLFELLVMLPIVKEIVTFVIASGLLFYVALNANDINVTKIFMILGFICIFMIPIVVIIRYLEKMSTENNKEDL